MAKKSTLYIFVGLPGAGKTTTAKYIEQLTKAHHIWTDYERLQKFTKPCFSQSENDSLYLELNQLANRLLKSGQDVIFDTNFNFYKDRQFLRKIANQNNAVFKLIWMTTPKKIAYQRAVALEDPNHLRVLGSIDHQTFEEIAARLEPPKETEHPVKIDGLNLDIELVKKALSL